MVVDTAFTRRHFFRSVPVSVGVLALMSQTAAGSTQPEHLSNPTDSIVFWFEGAELEVASTDSSEIALEIATTMSVEMQSGHLSLSPFCGLAWGNLERCAVVMTQAWYANQLAAFENARKTHDFSYDSLLGGHTPEFKWFGHVRSGLDVRNAHDQFAPDLAGVRYTTQYVHFTLNPKNAFVQYVIGGNTSSTVQERTISADNGEKIVEYSYAFPGTPDSAQLQVFFAEGSPSIPDRWLLSVHSTTRQMTTIRYAQITVEHGRSLRLPNLPTDVPEIYSQFFDPTRIPSRLYTASPLQNTSLDERIDSARDVKAISAVGVGSCVAVIVGWRCVRRKANRRSCFNVQKGALECRQSS